MRVVARCEPPRLITALARFVTVADLIVAEPS